MTELFNFIFDNFLFVVFLGIIYYIYLQYKDLKEKTASINELFDKVLNKYLEEKIVKAQETTDRILKEYGKEDTVSTEINRLLLMIEKGVAGSINDKVLTSNALNKFKLSKKIDFEKYPYLLELENLGTFTENDLSSVDNGVAIARREYNAQAFRYNEKASSFFMQYLTKFLKLNQQYIIFDAPRSSYYDENYEVFEEDEPEINSLATLNRTDEEDEVSLNDLIYDYKPVKKEVEFEHSDLILKPSVDLEEKDNEKKN